MINATEQTIGQWLESVAVSDCSNDFDSNRMQHLLRRIGFPSAICTLGIVYLEGHGTIDAPPMSIHTIAKMLVEKAKHS